MGSARVSDTVGFVKRAGRTAGGAKQSPVPARPAAETVDGRRARWADHRTARRAELIEATIAAVRRHGAGVGMDQIAAVAGTSKPVIYRHFSDKADLYRAVGGRMADDLVIDIARATADVVDPRERMARGIDAFFQVLEHNPQLYQFIVGHPWLDTGHSGKRTGPRGEELVADYIGRVEQLITRLLLDQPGIDVSVAQARLWGTCIVGLVRAAGEWWLAEQAAAAAGGESYLARTAGSLLTREQLTDQVTTLTWSGVMGGVLGPDTGFPSPTTVAAPGRAPSEQSAS